MAAKNKKEVGNTVEAEVGSPIVKVGKIEITKNTVASPYIPQNGGNFIDHGDILKTLALGIRDNLAVLLIGESGTGKTSAIRYLAAQTNNPLRRVNLNGGTTADELVGRQMINEKGTYWVDGVLTEAMRRGEWIVLDEINAALPEVLFVLQSVLDDDGYLVLNEKDDKEIVHKNPNFRVFATCNPPEYAGTKEMNKALLSRFHICINTPFPKEEQELQIVKYHLGDTIAQSEMATKLVKMANDTRTAKEAGNADFAINTRDILSVLKLSEHMDPLESFALGFANKLDAADRTAVLSSARLTLPQTKKKASAQRITVQCLEDLKIGSTFVLTADMQDIYYGSVSASNNQAATLESSPIENILSGMPTEDGVKEDEFEILGAYYEQTENAPETIELTTKGERVASLVQFSKGSQKGNKAVIFHNPGLKDTIEIINNLVEIK